MESFKYKGQNYNIQDLLLKPEKYLSGRQKMALKSFRKKSNQSEICYGFFGVDCDKEQKIAGLCHSCYRKQQHLRGINSFISEVYGIRNMDVSTSNILNFSQSPCIKCSLQKCTVTYPFCALCLSNACGLAIRPSFISGAGLGLFAMRDFRRGEILELEYTGNFLNQEEYLALKNSAMSDSRAARKLDYVMEILNAGSYIDASDEKGGPLRYINQAPSHELKNSKWLVKDGRGKVKTLEAIKTGCEFYLDYSQDTLQFSAPEYMSIDAWEQQEKIIRHFIDIKQDESRTATYFPSRISIYDIPTRFISINLDLELEKLSGVIVYGYFGYSPGFCFPAMSVMTFRPTNALFVPFISVKTSIK